MGEVYRARDTKLGREVAIKVLPASVAGSHDRLARFEREARVLATLNHTNIAAIYGVEDSTDVRALVLELVEGPTLADRIHEGPIPPAEALPIARQIAEALEAAHEHGIVHRDLKPSNIKVRHDGAVKVLDFGLAKLTTGPSDSDQIGDDSHERLAQSPTITRPPLVTHVGVILGTAAYMAPEQAKGEPADKRSDIWAFGCVLFEMLAGRPTFEGRNVTDTLSLVRTKDPDWSALPADVPARIRALLARCLQRDRRTRIGDAAALRFVLEELARLETPAAGTTSLRRGTGRRVWMLAATLAAIVTVAVVAYRYRPAPTVKPFAFSILPPEGTTFVGLVAGGAPALSPDGHQVAFIGNSAGRQQLWVQSLDAFDARPIAGTEGAACPFWAADGSWLGFFVNETLMKVNAGGGQAQRLAGGGSFARGGVTATVNRDGTILFYGPANTLASISASGGESRQATERNIALFDENHTGPSFLPDGRHYLLHVRGGPELQLQVWVGQLGSNERRQLLKDVTNARYAPPLSSGPGHLVYVRSGTLVAQAFDVHALTLPGSPMTIGEGIAVAGGGAVGDFDVSQNVLVFRRGQPGTYELAQYDRGGGEVGTFGDRGGNPRNSLRISPDGKWAAFTRMGDTTQDVWIADLASGAISRFTLDGGRSPVWSPDGSQLAYLRQGTVYRKPFAGRVRSEAVERCGHAGD